jgi:multiple sugar transport system substrate-binding protein
MLSEIGKRISRRQCLAAACFGPFVIFPARSQARERTLRIAKWSHFVPQFNSWFEEMAQEWGRQRDTTVTVDNLPMEQIWGKAKAEAQSGNGHDVWIFPWPPAEFQQFSIDHAEIYDKLAFGYGSIPQIAYRSTLNPKTKQHFALADYWVPSPFQYFADFWTEANMPLGPIHYGSLRSGGQRIRAKLGIPCGLSFAPTLEGNVTSHTLFYAFRGQIFDAAGSVAINRNAFTAEALKYVKALSTDAGTPEEFTWGPSGNVKAMLARKASCTINGIGLARAAEQANPGIARQIQLQPPLLGPYGVTAFPYVTNCSLVWKFAKNPEGAKEFLVGLIDQSKAGYEKSLGCNFPIYPKTIPNLIVRLEKDSNADPPDKYGHLKDALHWTPNLGSPGFATPAWMEVFNSSALPKLFADAVKGELSIEEAARAAESTVKRIAEKWKDI